MDVRRMNLPREEPRNLRAYQQIEETHGPLKRPAAEKRSARGVTDAPGRSCSAEFCFDVPLAHSDSQGKLRSNGQKETRKSWRCKDFRGLKIHSHSLLSEVF